MCRAGSGSRRLPDADPDGFSPILSMSGPQTTNAKRLTPLWAVIVPLVILNIAQRDPGRRMASSPSSSLPRQDDHFKSMQSVTEKGFIVTKYEKSRRGRSRHDRAGGLVVLNGKEGSGYAVHADGGLNELLPSILRRAAKMI